MGIKFLCTQCGKKLNVKAFLAGKRAICPHCSHKIEIPPEAAEHTIVTGVSPLAALRSSGGAAAMAAPAHPAAVPTRPATVPTAAPAMHAAPASAHPSGTHPAALPAAPFGAPALMPHAAGAPSGAMPIPAAPQPAYAAPAPALPMPAPAPLPQPATPPDPITEAPTAVWYVRPPTGGQFGPAPGDTMRKWITEGRVTADSLVWREGWADWKNAGGTFPALGATLPPPSSASAVGPSVTTPAKSSPLTTRGGGSSLAMTLVIVLVILIIPLLGILIWVLTRNSGTPTPAPRKDTARLLRAAAHAAPSRTILRCATA